MSLLLTVQLMVVAMAIAAIVGIVGAWAASTVSEFRGHAGNWLSRAFLMAMVIAAATPLVLHAAAWEATAGKFGWLPLTQVGASGYGGLGGIFGGLVACGWIHGLFGGSLVALATWYGTRHVSPAVIQQSQMELGPVGIWWRVRLPLAMPWVFTSLLATAALAATEMTVVDLYGFRTLADRFYLQFVVDPTVGAIGTTIALPMFFAAGILYVLFSKLGPSLSGKASIEPSRSTESVSQKTTIIANVLCVLIAALVVVVPWLGIVIKAGHDVVVVGSERTVSWSASRFVENVASAPGTFAAEYRWTIMLATITGGVALALAWFLASVGRTRSRLRSTIDLLTIAAFLIPGPIVGLAIVRLFQMDLPGFRVLYHQTLFPTVVGLLVRSLPVAYWVMRSGYQGIDDNLLSNASLDGTWFRRMWKVDFGLLKYLGAAAFLGAVIVASGDVPVLLPVIPPGVTTVGTRLFEQLHSGARYQEASLAFWYVLAITILAIISSRWAAGSHGRMS
ncbi:MAG: amino acid ABC transporter permease [Pirellulaceae bacterium]